MGSGASAHVVSQSVGNFRSCTSPQSTAAPQLAPAPLPPSDAEADSASSERAVPSTATCSPSPGSATKIVEASTVGIEIHVQEPSDVDLTSEPEVVAATAVIEPANQTCPDLQRTSSNTAAASSKFLASSTRQMAWLTVRKTSSTQLSFTLVNTIIVEIPSRSPVLRQDATITSMPHFTPHSSLGEQPPAVTLQLISRPPRERTQLERTQALEV